MLVKEIMTTNVITVSPESSLSTALELINCNRIRHLPVIFNGKLVGIVSDRDLRDAKPSVLSADDNSLLSNITVEKIMKRNVVSAHPLDAVDEAALLLYKHRIGCLPVINNGKIVGIITHGDLIRALVELMGVETPGSLIIIEFLDRPGVLAEVSKIISDKGININSVFLRKVKERPTFSILTMRIGTSMPDTIVKELRRVGLKVLWP